MLERESKTQGSKHLVFLYILLALKMGQGERCSFLGLLLLGQSLHDLFLLGLETLLAALAGLLCLGAAGFGLVTVRVGERAWVRAFKKPAPGKGGDIYTPCARDSHTLLQTLHTLNR